MNVWPSLESYLLEHTRGLRIAVLLSILVLTLVSIARADDTGTTVGVDTLPRFITLHEAAMWLGTRLELCSHYYECAGPIFINPAGKFVPGPVHTDYHSDHVSVDHGAPTGWKLAADMHSHPCLPEHETGMFSPQDMIGAIVQRTTSFMVDLCTGDIHEFLPGITKPDTDVVDDGVWLTKGRIIGRISAYPDGPRANEGT